jgi:hypothetical protein
MIPFGIPILAETQRGQEILPGQPSSSPGMDRLFRSLYVESINTPVPAGNAHEAPFLSLLGYSGSDYVVADSTVLSGFVDFRTELEAYSAIVVASDHGGMLTATELGFLNAHSSEVIDYLNSGSGLAAFAESNATGLLGSTPRFQFLPFLVSSVDFNVAETGNTVTAFGASLGLTNFDVNGNFSHNYFATTGGMTPVDLFNGDPNRPLSLATRSTVGPGGVIPEPATVVLIGLGIASLVVLRRRNSYTR